MTSIITIESSQRPVAAAPAPTLPSAAASLPGRRIASALVTILTVLLLGFVGLEVGVIVFGWLVVAGAELGGLIERFCGALQVMLSAPGYWR